MPFSTVLLLVVVVAGALALRRFEQRSRSGAGRATTFPYYARRALFSEAERAFLGVLEEAAGEHYRVFGKVRLADVLGVQRGTPAGERQRALNRVLQKHVDFVVCRPADLVVVALVELDDATHARGDRRTRDAFLERACSAAGVKLLRFPAKSGYVLTQVRAALAELEATPGVGPLPGAATTNP